MLGIVEGRPVLGIPGYPVSALVTSELFLKRTIGRCLGVSTTDFPSPRLTALTRGPTAEAVVTRKIYSPAGEDEFLRVRLGRVDGNLVATPIRRGAGVIMSLVEADGICPDTAFLGGSGGRCQDKGRGCFGPCMRSKTRSWLPAATT